MQNTRRVTYRGRGALDTHSTMAIVLAVVMGFMQTLPVQASTPGCGPQMNQFVNYLRQHGTLAPDNSGYILFPDPLTSPNWAAFAEASGLGTAAAGGLVDILWDMGKLEMVTYARSKDTAQNFAAFKDDDPNWCPPPPPALGPGEDIEGTEAKPVPGPDLFLLGIFFLAGSGLMAYFVLPILVRRKKAT